MNLYDLEYLANQILESGVFKFKCEDSARLKT